MLEVVLLQAGMVAMDDTGQTRNRHVEARRGPRAPVVGIVRARVIKEGLFRLLTDQSGNYLTITAVLMPVLIGFAGLATDVGLWLLAHQTMQSAADSGAVSAATAYAVSNADNLTTQASAVTSYYGFVNGVSGVTVTANRPPTSGAHQNSSNAVEVIVQQPQKRFLSVLWGSGQVNVQARSVALANGGIACVLSLDGTASGAITAQGSTNIALNACGLFSDSNNSASITDGGSATLSAYSVGAVGGVSGSASMTTTMGVTTGDAPLPDPYAGTTFPSFSGCDQHNFTAKTTITINPGVYCGGIGLNANANVTLNPGIYYLDQGSLSVNGGATLTGDGVTLVFTSSKGSNYATASINGGATVDLSAPTSGPLAGIVMFGDQSMPVGTTFKLDGGSTQAFSGAVYLPKAATDFAGGASTSLPSCTQLISDTITFTGNSNFAVNCGSQGTKPIGSMTAKRVE